MSHVDLTGLAGNNLRVHDKLGSRSKPLRACVPKGASARRPEYLPHIRDSQKKFNGLGRDDVFELAKNNQARVS
jgi:hypothetical protein